MTTAKGMIVSAICLGLTACAGPMSPFGSIEITDANSILNTRSPSSSSDPILLASEMREQRADIKFFPGRQKLHDQQTFTVIINDPDMILPVSKIKLFYNDIDVTNSFLKRAVVKMTEDNQKMKLIFDFLRLPAHKDHRISVKYQRDHFSKPIWGKYLPPYCHMQEEMNLGKVKRFEVARDILKMIDEETKAFNYNPNFLAGLIAQESAFDNKAVSHARAIGLTQITPLAAKEIEQTSAEWPKHTEIDSMPIWRLKQLINQGEINSNNDWRLDYRKSIIGGLSYLKYVDNYWRSQQTILEQILPNYQNFWEDLLLASYNSGPARVKGAVLDMGSHFLDHQELREAKKYVNYVKSYCYDFAYQSEDI